MNCCKLKHYVFAAQRDIHTKMWIIPAQFWESPKLR